MTPAEVAAKLQHFNDWRRGGDIEQPGPLAVGEVIDAAVEMIERLEDAEKSADWHKRRWMALQMHQTKMREPERTIVCDILANGELIRPTVAGDRYALQGAAHAPSVPVDLITDYLVSISAHVAHQDDPKAQAEIGELLRMLAAAQEAKP